MGLRPIVGRHLMAWLVRETHISLVLEEVERRKRREKARAREKEKRFQEEGLEFSTDLR